MVGILIKGRHRKEGEPRKGGLGKGTEKGEIWKEGLVGWMDVWMDGWTDEWMNGWTDGWTLMN